MLRDRKVGSIGLALIVTMWPDLAKAQSPDTPDLMALDRGALRSEVRMRYDAALTLSTDQAIVSANSPRYLWALQAKAQCGIALGFLKSGTKDPVSVSKCDDAFKRMQLVPPPPPPPPPDLVCNVRPYIVFFEWDKSDITPEAAATLDNTASNLHDCGFPQFEVDGYTDRSGSDAYNQALSLRRAEAVRAYLVAHQVPDTGIVIQGFGETNPRVPTADGVRELQNRRVEISVK